VDPTTAYSMIMPCLRYLTLSSPSYFPLLPHFRSCDLLARKGWVEIFNKQHFVGCRIACVVPAVVTRVVTARRPARGCRRSIVTLAAWPMRR